MRDPEGTSMRSHGRRTVALLGVVLLVSAAGCSSPRPKGHRGGTLYVLEATDFAHLDPGRATTAAEADYGRLLYRTLTSYALRLPRPSAAVAPPAEVLANLPAQGAGDDLPLRRLSDRART
jgi:peptide/nickel transport system substrate-binding protein